MNIVPCSDESSLGDSISFGLDDVFVLGAPKNRHTGITVLNSIFTVVEEGKNMARILAWSKVLFDLHFIIIYMTIMIVEKINLQIDSMTI